MKKLVSLLLAALMLLGMATAALAEAAPETVTITSLNAEREPVELEVPYDPQRIAILDMPSLDILDRLGLGDRVVGSATTTLAYLQAYVPGDTIANLGTINPDAAEEYDALKVRYDYLAAQLDDLDRARRSLAKINRVIDARMKEDFIRTYEAVDRNFQEIFSILFPGGSANLSLVDPDDLENTDRKSVV